MAAIWKESLALLPLVVSWCAMRYVASLGFGRECYLHEGVAWVAIVVGFPCFVLSLVGVVVLMRKLEGVSVSRRTMRLGIAVVVPAAYVLPFAVGDNGHLLQAMVCGAR